MTATEKLRTLLDKRGVEWYEPVQMEGSIFTRWINDGVSWTASMVHGRDNALRIGANTVTPEQAIAATLGSDAKPCYATDYTHGRCKYSVNRGWTEDTKFYVPTLRRGTLTAEQVRETVEKHWHDLSADYGMPEATALPEYSYDWQAIADALNAALGSGTCRLEETEWVSLEVPLYRCSECDGMFEDGRGDYRYCPYCGAKVVDA